MQEIKHISEWIPQLAEELYSRGTQPAIPIKSLPKFNRGIWGLKPKALTVVGARTSQGKSAFALQLAWDISSQGIPVWLLSLEMDVLSLLERLYCHVHQVDNYEVLSGKFKNNAVMQRKFLEFKKSLEDSKLLMTCGLGRTFSEINAMIELVDEKPKVVIVDYIQNISFKSGDTREIINEYIRHFRNMAIGYGFAGVLCSQINRSAEEQKDREPTLAQLKESGFIEESADTVLLLHWKGMQDKEARKKFPPPEEWEYVINVAKQRNGPTGNFLLNYIPKHYLFREIGSTRELMGREIKSEPVPIVDHAKEAAGDDVQYALDLFNGKMIDPEGYLRDDA